MYIMYLEDTDSVTENFGEVLWCSRVQKVIVKDDIRFIFKNEFKIKQEIRIYNEVLGLLAWMSFGWCDCYYYDIIY